MLTFFHAPRSRSCATHWLLAELGIAYETRILDIRSSHCLTANECAIWARGRVPAIVHGTVTVTECAAIAAYLADTFPQAGLAPAPEDRRRGRYLDWLTHVDSALAPAIRAERDGRVCGPRNLSEGLRVALAPVELALSRSAYAVGDRFTAADTALGGALYWGVDILGLIPERPVFRAYLARLGRRAAFHATIGSDAVEDFARAA